MSSPTRAAPRTLAARCADRVASLLALLLVFGATAAGADPPEGGASAPSPDPPVDAVLADLPFLDSDEPNRVLVDLAPEGGRPLRMMLDTGATDCIVTPRYARALGVSVRAVKDTPYRRTTRLGRDLLFWVDVRSSDTGSKTGWEYGLLGGTFLAEYVIDLDFAARRVRFLDAGKYAVPESTSDADEAVVPIQIVGNRPVIDVEIDGRSVSVLMDTGAPDAGVLSGPAAKRVGLEPRPLPGLDASGVLGPVDVEFAEAGSLRIGRFELAHVPMEVAPKGWYNQGASSDSVIGYDVLAQFHVRIDYPRQRLWLRRLPSSRVTYAGVPYAEQRRAGVLVYPRKNGLYVNAVFPDSPAERLGLRAGDLVDRPASEPQAAFEARTLAAIADGQELTVARELNGVRVDVPLPGGLPATTAEDPKD